MNIDNKKSLQSDTIILFEKGMNGSANYRIPSLITTSKGTLIAAIDARVHEPGDNPNKIDKVVKRSIDQGVTWSDVNTIVSYPGYGRENGAAAIDPAMLEDKETQTIWMIYSHTPARIGLWNSEPGTGFSEERYRLLYDTKGNSYTLQEEGRVFDENGEETLMKVDTEGYVYKEGKEIGNIYLADSQLFESKTSFLQIIYSKDDGVTWSKPRELNMEVKAPWMQFIGSGPGVGIQLTLSKYRGRLIFPVYFSNTIDRKMSCAVIYSDDHGETWKMGTSPNDGRKAGNTLLSAETLAETDYELTESQVVELDNGDLKAFMRNHNKKRRTATSISKDGGETWGEVVFQDTLLDPICQASVIKYPDQGDGRCRVIFSNPADEKERVNGTIRLSEDGGKTWSYSRLLKEGSYVYSSLTVLPNGHIGILYETEENGDMKNCFTTFSLEWIMEGENK
ncbi:MAG: exo-alpha-sialidase [Epulopiscium sp.]|nr:exo-alpha-sialidase [Candidatus Epulonipiscium sp.]